MELRFIGPDLAQLDDFDLEILACSVWTDARPSHGVAGLCDFRLGGRISELERKNLITGALGEVVLLPGKPRLSFDKVILFGAGPRMAFNDKVFVSVVSAMLATVEGLSARSAAVELPGRHEGLLTAERAAGLLLDCAAGSAAHDVWTLIENAEGKQRITEHMVERRKLVRRHL